MKPTMPSKTNPEDWVKNKLLILGALISFLGIITGAAESILKFIVIAESNFYLISTLIWLALIILLTQIDFHNVKLFTLKGKRLKIVAIISATVIFLFSIFWKYYELHIRKTKHAEQPSIFLGLAKREPGFFASLSIVSEKEVPFKVEDMQINEEMCSFIESMEEVGTPPRETRTFSFNLKLAEAFKNGSCFGVEGDKPAREVLPILQERLDKIGKSDLKLYITSTDDLSRIIRERGDIFKQIMFSSDEIQSLKQTSPSQYETVKQWILNCIGVKQPVIMFTLLNNSNKDILINKVVYNVSEVADVKGGEAGPVYPLITYNHVLEHKKGLQNKNLNPVLLLKANDRVTFNIRLIPSSKGPGLTWVMKIRFYDSMNRFAETEPLQLIMSK